MKIIRGKSQGDGNIGHSKQGQMERDWGEQWPMCERKLPGRKEGENSYTRKGRPNWGQTVIPESLPRCH